MCEHHGISPRALESARRALAAPNISRRGLLRGAGAMTLSMAVAGGAGGKALAAGESIKSTHGAGFCNLNLFLAHAEQLAAEDGLHLEFINTPTFADQVTFLGTGAVDIGLTPYTSFMALYDAGVPVTIVAGGGVEGCAVVSQPGLDSPEKLKGKILGTFQMDTLEVLPFDYLRKHGISFNDLTIRYLGGMAEAAETFKAGAIDIFSTIEPYASAMLNDVPGSHLLTDGTDLYGPGYTDCILAARSDLIAERPEALKALIKAMMRAQQMAEADPAAVLSKVVGTYYKTSMENAAMAMEKQPAVVDARSQTDFILERVESVAEMGYIKQKPGRDAIDWTLLEEVIDENPDLYASLKLKSA
ncbi:MAG: ABC transporter substrate-binding protein [Rubrimonas sp.]